MTLPSSQHNSSQTDLKSESSAIKMLDQLLEVMRNSDLLTDGFEYYVRHRFSWDIKDKYNPFGYDLKEQPAHNAYVSYRKNRLRHKLYRIQQEIDFVKNNIDAYHRLTSREKEIIQLLAKGKNNPEIAKFLCISRSTVEQHRKHVNQKLKIESFSQLIHFCYAFDFV